MKDKEIKAKNMGQFKNGQKYRHTTIKLSTDQYSHNKNELN